MLKDFEKSPFIYGSTVSVFSFTNREDDAKKLKNNLLSGINTSIISPRRWGKSSLVEKVMHDIKQDEPHVKVLMLDLFSVSSQDDFLELLAKEVIKASSSKWEEWVNNCKTFFSSLIPKINFSLDPQNDFSLSFDKQELQAHSDEILNLAEKIAQEKNYKFIICLDEFQNLAYFKDFEKFEKQLRSFWQKHKHVTYCLYGSKRHMMTDIFNNPSKPFYRFGDIILLPKIKTEKWVSFICQSFANTHKQIDEDTAKLIAQSMKDHSWYVQQLAHYTWNLTHKKATINEVEKALEELIRANTPLYQNEIESLSATQVQLLKAIAQGEHQLLGTETMRKYAIGTSNNIRKNKALLIQKDIIDENVRVLSFLDPAFELWFRKVFLNQNNAFISYFH